MDNYTVAKEMAISLQVEGVTDAASKMFPEKLPIANLLQMSYRVVLTIIFLIIGGGIAADLALADAGDQMGFSNLLTDLIGAPLQTIDFIVYWGSSWIISIWPLSITITFLSLGFEFRHSVWRIAGWVAVALFSAAAFHFFNVSIGYGIPQETKLALSKATPLMYTAILAAIYAFAITRFSPTQGMK